MLYLAVGTPANGIQELAEKVLPIMKAHGVSHDLSTFVPLAGGFTTDASGQVVDRNVKVLVIPPFESIDDLESLVEDLSSKLGYVVCTSTTDVVAAVAGLLL